MMKKLWHFSNEKCLILFFGNGKSNYVKKNEREEFKKTKGRSERRWFSDVLLLSRK